MPEEHPTHDNPSRSPRAIGPTAMAPSHPSPPQNVHPFPATSTPVVPVAEQGWVALMDSGSGRPEACEIVDWYRSDTELIGYVHDAQRGRIIRADLHPDFLGYELRPRVVTALPGMGWTAYYRMDTPMGPITQSRPVLAWLVHDDGTVLPYDVDHDGLVYCSTDTDNLDRVEPPAPTR
ncbi:hypothetical protein [Streptomyces lydicus]|uniref:hypothetical protein n=1 Tax=Streptomyces lydicus TaxID=47763 RepID=UPI003787C768